MTQSKATMIHSGQTMMERLKEMRNSDPNSIDPETADTLAWATAQGSAISKLKIFTNMAKSINDQQ